MAARTGRQGTLTAARAAGGMLAAAALSAGALYASTLSTSPPASAVGSSGKSLTIITEHVPKVGTVLATKAGLTLYDYTVDPAGRATCTGACAKAWPPLLLPKGVTHVKAPRGVKGLTAVRVQGGRLQLFFHDHALYRFVSDSKKGEAAGQGVANEWFAVLSSGKSSASEVGATPTSTGGAAPSSSPSPSPYEYEHAPGHEHDVTERHEDAGQRDDRYRPDDRRRRRQVCRRRAVDPADDRPADDRPADDRPADNDAADKPSHHHDDRSSDGRGRFLRRPGHSLGAEMARWWFGAAVRSSDVRHRPGDGSPSLSPSHRHGDGGPGGDRVGRRHRRLHQFAGPLPRPLGGRPRRPPGRRRRPSLLSGAFWPECSQGRWSSRATRPIRTARSSTTRCSRRNRLPSRTAPRRSTCSVAWPMPGTTGSN